MKKYTVILLLPDSARDRFGDTRLVIAPGVTVEAAARRAQEELADTVVAGSQPEDFQIVAMFLGEQYDFAAEARALLHK